jgi:sterol desaturase/sphingolipid hydroxylase (fatty acid hydroxylase superfamily)
MLNIWQAVAATFPAVKVFVLGVAGFTILEQMFPAELRQPFKNHVSNFQYVVLYYLLTPIAMIWPTVFVAALAQRWGAGLIHIDLDHVHVGIAALEWPMRNILLPFAPAVIYDFFYYWHHRLQHRSLVFWPIHRLHHSTESLNALAAFRIHWLEEPMRVFTMTIPAILLFHITPVEGAWMAVVLGQLGVFIHVNIRVPFGPFTKVLMGPQLHRLHHSPKPEHLDRNYSAIFPMWDVLFGTYVAPKPGEWPGTGLAGGERAGTVLQETAHPFIKWGGGSLNLIRGGGRRERTLA